MQRHVRILGWLFIAYSGLLDAIAILVGLLVTGGATLSGDRQAMVIAGAVSIGVVTLLLILSIPGFIAGIGLLKLRPWARIVAIILAILNILSFPLGMALAIYTLWVLLNTQTAPLFQGGQPGGAQPPI